MSCCVVCCASMCAGMCCNALNECGSKRGTASRVPYMFLMFVASIFAVIMSMYGDRQLFHSKLLGAQLKACNSAGCKGNGSVYRVSFALFVFFLLHTVAVRKYLPFHWLWLKMKLLCFVIGLIILFFVPAPFFEAYAEFARVASVVFLVLQVVVLLMWAMDTSDELQNTVSTVTHKVQNDEYDDEAEANEEMKRACCYKIILLGGTLAMLGICAAVWVMSFMWFGNSGAGCEGEEALVGVTIVLVLVMYILTFYAPHGSIFTTSVIAMYVTYLLFSALSANTDEDCNDFAKDGNDTAMWLGIVFTALSISYVGFSVSKRVDLCWEDDVEDEEDAGGAYVQDTDGVDLEVDADLKDSNYDDDKQPVDSNYDDLKDDKKKKDSGDESKSASLDGMSAAEVELEKRQNFLFHMCMTFAGIYISMLYTNWATDTTNDHTARGRGKVSLAVNICAQYLAFALYTWLLAAPKIFPERFPELNSRNASD